MKKGDLLLCNDGITKVEIADFDEYSVSVAYEGKIHKRPIRCIGKTLHCINHCWNCGDEISTLFCDRCSVCGWRVCRKCGSCQEGACVYKAYGFDANGIHRNGTRYSDEGYDVLGYDRDGYDRYGYDRDSYDRGGFDRYGVDRDGFNQEGFNKQGYNRNGYDRYGYDQDGYDIEGYDSKGFDREGYNRQGYDKNWLDRSGYNPMGFDKDGYDIDGYNRDGYNRRGINREGFDRNGCDAHWRKLIGRKIVYIGADSKKKGKIIKCYVVNEVHYIDVEFINGEIYRKINFVFARRTGILKLLKKKSSVEAPKTIPSVKKTETRDVSDDVRDIFDELQDYYECDGEYHTGFGGCYGEDDRESEYYNPTHPYDD